MTYTPEGEDATAETKNFNAKVSTTTTVKVESAGVIAPGESGDFVITNDTNTPFEWTPPALDNFTLKDKNDETLATTQGEVDDYAAAEHRHTCKKHLFSG